MNKHLKWFTLSLLCFFSLLFLSGCSSFFGSDSEGVQIQSISTEVQSDGSTKMIIQYTDEDRKPDEFIIPKGIAGNGIQSILTNKNDKDGSTTLTILFTDETVKPVEFTIQNGVSIVGLEPQIDEETNDVYICVKYSDGTTSEPMLLPKGEKGEDGNSFIGYDQTINEDNSVTIYFHFSKSEDVIITIPSPQKGETGKGIQSIVSFETEVEYVLQIQYTDGTSEELKFNRPKDANQWYNGGTRPSDTLGVNGDYYFDIYHNCIYVKEGGSWTLITDFNGNEQNFSVRFDLNDTTDEPAQMPTGAQLAYSIKRGSYFTTDGYSIPIPTRVGYEFKGWYTSKVVTPVTGHFTDLTPIFDNITLYAIWEKVN